MFSLQTDLVLLIICMNIGNITKEIDDYAGRLSGYCLLRIQSGNRQNWPGDSWLRLLTSADISANNTLMSLAYCQHCCRFFTVNFYLLF